MRGRSTFSSNSLNLSFCVSAQSQSLVLEYIWINSFFFFSYNPVWIINSSAKTHLAFENLICQTRGKVASYKSQLRNASFPGSCWSLLFPEREPPLRWEALQVSFGVSCSSLSFSPMEEQRYCFPLFCQSCEVPDASSFRNVLFPRG